VKTSGSKGFHIVVPMPARATFETSSALADHVAGILVAQHPTMLTREFSKADRGGRIFVDTARNRAGATFAAAYTVRARAGAPVSAPCTWDEVENGTARPQTFTLRTMADRVAAVGDLWHDLPARKAGASRPREAGALHR
jgi:bifunctional non-homologous end joining protein LigD